MCVCVCEDCNLQLYGSSKTAVIGLEHGLHAVERVPELVADARCEQLGLLCIRENSSSVKIRHQE